MLVVTITGIAVQAVELGLQDKRIDHPRYFWPMDLIIVLFTLTELLLKVGGATPRGGRGYIHTCSYSTCMYAHPHTHSCMHTRMHIHVHMYAHTSTHTCTYPCMHAHAHTCTHAVYSLTRTHGATHT